jgi:hypothetical protein
VCPTKACVVPPWNVDAETADLDDPKRSADLDPAFGAGALLSAVLRTAPAGRVRSTERRHLS